MRGISGFHKKLFASVVLLALVTGNAAKAEISFVEGGYAEICTNAALKAEVSERIILTGSRLGLPPVDVCTLATSAADLNQTNVAGSYNNRGVLQYIQKNFLAALADFDNALVLAPDEPAYHLNRGYTLTALQRWEESRQAYSTGIALGAPELDKAYFNRGIANEELGNVREAYHDYRKAAELNPLWEEPREELARFSIRR